MLNDTNLSLFLINGLTHIQGSGAGWSTESGM